MHIKSEIENIRKNFNVQREDNEFVVALGGNPNVGKSTVFNALTGLKQHTGNWPGKTVVNAQGRYRYSGESFVLVDLPGTYSLLAHSVEEEVARDFMCFGESDAVVIVCDATCLERNLNLVLQTLEITDRVVVCVNMMDEAKKKKISINMEALAEHLGCPVVGCSARSKKGLKELMNQIKKVCERQNEEPEAAIPYPRRLEEAISMVQPVVEGTLPKTIRSRWLSLRLLDEDASILSAAQQYLGTSIKNDQLDKVVHEARKHMKDEGILLTRVTDEIVSSIVKKAESIYAKTVCVEKKEYNVRDRKLDKILTSKWTGIPIMLLLLAAVFWITITGANYPSKILADGLFWIEERLLEFFVLIGAPAWVSGVLISGIYRVLAWVVSVMLPPMAIFFPLFTLLEDFGYLPRVAFNLDKTFKKCCACGKQALTMCMGFGCNAAGIVGCRIIDSPRERLIAIITNNFVPCNGRFPTLIAIISMFFGFTLVGTIQSVASALILTGVIVLGVLMTFLISKVLSKTILKGVPSSFTLELPPYRRPQIGRVIIRSLLDRTLFVLGRAVMVAAPAGLIIWVMANVNVDGVSLLTHCIAFLDPFAHLIGLDGVILMAFILGFPANEIVIPIVIMAYMSQGALLELDSLQDLKDLLMQNGWTWLTAVCTMLFSLMHWPCSTACLTIKKETQSWKWTVISFIVPTATGLVICFVVANAARLLGLV